MSFLKSIIFGTEGSYNIFGTDVTFKKSNSPSFSFAASMGGSGLLGTVTKSIGYLADHCLNSKAFHIATQGCAHAFVHEMAHTFAFRTLTNIKPNVTIFTDLCVGENDITFFDALSLGAGSPKIASIVFASGPLANMAFSSCKLVGTLALRAYLPTAVTVTVSTGAVMWMTGELFLAYASFSNGDRGDFDRIARKGSTHLAVASTALIGQFALGIFAASKFI